MMSRFQRIIALVAGLLGPQSGHAAAISSHELARPEGVRPYLVMQPDGLPATQRPVGQNWRRLRGVSLSTNVPNQLRNNRCPGAAVNQRRRRGRPA